MRLLGELTDTMKPLPSMDGQLTLIMGNQAEEQKTSAFTFSQEIIDAVLTRGSGVSEGKMRIYEQFEKSLSAKENADFLKKEYGWGGSYPVIIGAGIDEQHDGNGITISKGIGSDKPHITLSWSQVEKRIGDLIRMDRYLNPKEKEKYPEWLEKQEERRAELAEQRKNREILSTAPPEPKNKEDEPEAQYEYHLGDSVYIGASQYEILSFDENRVMLYDFDMPLFNKELSREEFDRKVRENPMNDHLKVSVLPAEEKAVTGENEAQNDTETVQDFNPKTGYDDAFFIDRDNESVTWMYYNPDSNAGGQYVTNTLSFDEIQQAAQEYDSAEDFFDYLGSIANQELADVGSEWFEDAESQFSQQPDFTDCTKATMQSLVAAVSEVPVYDRETKILYSVLGRLKIDDIELGYDENGLVARDGDNEWHGAEFYHFLVDEAFVFEDDGSVLGIRPDLLDDFKALSENNGVEVKDDREKEPEPIVPAWEQKKKSKVKSFDLHPDIPMSERHNFDLANNQVEEVNKKERFHRNYAAIKVLKDCQNENRFATPDEQKILSRYVGWGGIPEAFDERAGAWHTEYAMLKNTLTPEEYVSARESTLTAFYTPPEVSTAIYKVLEQMGFQEGNLLEPSCGIGNFIGMLPKSMENAKVYGVELDTVSAGIAQQLYQKSSIAAQGFEEVNVPDSFFDGVIGNVPFGDFKVSDKRYDKYNFLIHDYFFAKSLDKLRPCGVMALVTSKGTMDKENSNVRKYIAQRAELLGAIRLPNNTFKGNAGTEVVSDILFLQKRDRLIDIVPDWVHLDTDENGIRMNSYFVQHPEMILGEMKMVSGRFGPEATCEPFENADLSELLNEAVSNIHGEISEYEVADELEEEDNSIPADPTVRNFSYTVLDDKIYFRENSRMSPVEVSATAENRIKGMIGIRDCVRNLIELQTEDYPDSEIKQAQEKLNTLYDSFTKKYGLINSRANTSAFSDDSSYALLSALEVINEDGELERKADMFFKRTIKPHKPVTEVDTADEALAVSMGEKAAIDMEYMMELSGKSEEELFADLKGVIFLNPLYEYGNSYEPKYLMADEYLSGNVRDKLATAKRSAALYPEDYTVNVQALEKVQPKDLTASEISVRLGATWIPPEIFQQFMFEFLDTPRYAQWNIKVHYSQFTGEWNIEGKSYDRSNVKAYSTYGTSRINAYKIIEETLNLKDVRIFDYIEDDEGKKKAVLNKKETAIAQAKQELIKQGFQDWIWADPTRREKLTKLYNEKFNSIRPREYDGSHIVFNGMNPEIELREHQKNAVAHILYGGNTLLAHAVGAGKTFEMVAAAMESKRLGLCNKSLFVVPNHLTEQWAAEFLQLYPAANILVATKRDFETKNRKKFCGRIATGDYDAVIIGHSQFEKIPMSIERQRAILEQQLEELTDGIMDLKRNRGENFSIKQLEKSKKSVKQKLEKLNDQSRKDDVVTFEELGVDRLFIDESHYYKNLYLYTKMRNVGGIAQTEAQKSSDLFMKCRYLDELTGGRGTIFATGTPISNSMVELYTIQRYLQYNTLVKNNLQHFDSWASTFGETVTAVELTPEGTGYRAKTRFAKFYNLPELMAMFKEVADIKTADMLELPVPEAHFHNVAVKPSEMQKEMVASLAERAEKVRGGGVDSSVDNMLKITNDGRKLALDQRMLNDMLPDFEGSKINACVDNIYRIWEETADKKSAQLVFCDLSTPKNDGTFSVYNDIRKKLIERGVPESEVRFIHEADTDVKKKELFQKTRKGEVRVLLGSTQKMGAGTNVQDRLIALHDVDCPWRPSDLEQRSGRIIRQGNSNPDVDIYRYVTEQTFDAYLYQLVEGKQKFASQIMTSKSPVRSAEDIDETALSYAEIKMLATGNPYIKEKMDLDIQVQKLKLLKSNFLSERYALEDKIIKYYPQRISALGNRIEGLKQDVETAKQHPKPTDDRFVGMEVKGVFYSEKADAGKAIIEACKQMNSPDPIPLGKYRGFETELLFNTAERNYEVRLKGATSRNVPLGDDAHGNIIRLDNGIDRFAESLSLAENDLENTKNQLETAKKEVQKPFIQEEELKTKLARLDELNILLNMDKRENEIVGGEPDEGEVPNTRKEKTYER
ncbi:N-6 DNA methylase [Streptococcus suis]